MYICSRSWRRQPCGASRLRLHARPGGEGGPTWHAAADWRDMMSGGAALDPRWPGVRAHVAPCPTRHDVFRLRFRLRFRIHPIALLCLCFPPPPHSLSLVYRMGAVAGRIHFPRRGAGEQKQKARWVWTTVWRVRPSTCRRRIVAVCECGGGPHCWCAPGAGQCGRFVATCTPTSSGLWQRCVRFGNPPCSPLAVCALARRGARCHWHCPARPPVAARRYVLVHSLHRGRQPDAPQPCDANADWGRQRVAAGWWLAAGKCSSSRTNDRGGRKSKEPPHGKKKAASSKQQWERARQPVRVCADGGLRLARPRARPPGGSLRARPIAAAVAVAAAVRWLSPATVPGRLPAIQMHVLHTYAHCARGSGASVSVSTAVCKSVQCCTAPGRPARGRPTRPA